MRRLLLPVLSLLIVGLMLAGVGQAREPRCKSTHSCKTDRCARPWHGAYYHTAWGTPVVQLVPPNVELQTHWGWGVGNTYVTPICSQFSRCWPGQPVYDRSLFRPTPPWPSHTDQFGAYYMRGPW